MNGSQGSRGQEARSGTYLGLFLVTLATLMLEIGLTRIFSVTMWYHFAFVAISVALFGMTAGALLVHLAPHRFPLGSTKAQLSRFALLFGVAIALCFAVQLQIPFTPRFTVAGMASVIATCIVITIPFVCSGIVVCLALTRFPDRTNRLYAVDLLGAGLGCILLLVLFAFVDGPSLIVLVGAAAALGALAFALDARDRRGAAFALAGTVLLGGFGIWNAWLHADGRPVLDIVWVKEERDTAHLEERWNAFSRLTVDGDPADPAGTDLNLVIDGTAGTAINRFSGDRADSDRLRTVIQNLPHHVRNDADVFVIGAGGGTDVLSALEFGQRSVTGVEMNGDILDLANGTFGDYSGHLGEQPEVTLVNDEARSYLARTDRRYDIIQISLIDTWAATGAGAFALTENSLYTTEAWDLFLDRLEPGGILAVTRYFRTNAENGEAVEPLETYRTVALAAQVLTDRGVAAPRDHITIYRAPLGYFGVDLATVLVSRDPLSAADRLTLARTVDGLGFLPVLTPDVASDPMFAALTAPGGPGGAIDDVAADISPPTDDRPFFFQMADLDTFRRGDIFRDDFITRPVLTLAVLAVTVLTLAAACIVLPLALARRRIPSRGARRRIAPLYAYFAAIGLGFLLVEIAQLQRLSIFLGHPTYGLSVVLFSILVFSGLGSMLTERLVRDDQRTPIWPLGVLVAVVLASGLATPAVLRAMDGATTPTRIATAIALLAPMALAMGMPFSLGMRAAAAVSHAPTAFLWGINGAASVCASVFGVVLALFFGISVAFFAGTTAYAVALGAAAIATRRAAAEETAIDHRGLLEEDAALAAAVASATGG